jgi:hypothetical protein
MASLVVEAPSRILDAPRTLLLEAACVWLEVQPEFASLPNTEIVVSILSNHMLPPRYAGHGRDAVGCFAATRAGRLNPIWEVAVAYGWKFEDADEVEAWTVTLAHELLHLMAFAAAHGGLTPAQAGLDAVMGQFIDEAADSAKEDAVESLARTITARFAATHTTLFEDPALLPVAKVPVARHAKTPVAAPTLPVASGLDSPSF